MRKTNEGGFTFIELLLALTLFALIAAGVYHTFYAGMRMWAEDNAMMKETHRLRVFFNTISQDAVNATILYRGDLNDSAWTRDRMHFTVLENIYQNGKPDMELAQVTYLFDRKKGTLVRRYAPAKDGFDENLAKGTVFLEGLDAVTFEYSPGASASTNEYDWDAEWAGVKNDVLPCGIKINVRFKSRNTMPGEKFEKVIFVPAGQFAN